MRLFRVLITLLFVVSPIPLLAQTPPPVFELPDVIAPGRRAQPRTATPASISVITAAELVRLGVRTVGDALRFLPEVSVRGFGGPGAQQEVSIRGTASAHALILLDGVPVNSPALGLVGLQTLPIDAIERIEVLRGPFSAIYGSGALGGVINIVTRSGPIRAARVGGGSLGTASAGIQVGWTADRTRLSLGATHDSAAGFRANSDYSGQTFAGRVTFTQDERRSFSLGLARYQDTLGVPGSTAFPSPLARQRTDRNVVDATWRAGGAGASSGLLRGYWVEEAIGFTDPAFASSDLTRARAIGVEGQRVRQIGPTRVLTVGFEAQHQSVDARFSSAFGDSVVRRDAWIGAVYAVGDVALGPATVVSAGFRYDSHSVYGGQLNPRMGIVHRSDDRTILRFAVGRIFRGPTFLLLFFPGCSDPALRPERAWSADAGVERTLSPTLVARVTIFATQASDLISPGCPPTNVNAASIVGGSAELEGQLTPRLQVRANLSITNARDQLGVPLIRVPEFVASAALHYTLSASSTVSLLINHVGSRPDLDFSAFPAARVTLPGHTLVGLRYSLATGAGTLQFGVDNLFDVMYEAIKGFPAPGRTVFVSLARGL